jgi:hypothetical protein
LIPSTIKRKKGERERERERLKEGRKEGEGGRKEREEGRKEGEGGEGRERNKKKGRKERKKGHTQSVLSDNLCHQTGVTHQHNHCIFDLAHTVSTETYPIRAK